MKLKNIPEDNNPKKPRGGGGDPHRRLAAAVIADAVKDLTADKKEHRQTANDFLWSAHATRWLDYLNLEPQALRERLVAAGRLGKRG